MSARIVYSAYDSPIGALFVASGPRGLVRLDIGGKEEGFIAALSAAVRGVPERADARFSALFRALDGYFGGRPTVFGVALDPAGTAFDRAVWIAIASVPWGRSVSYGSLASLVGRPGAGRAVGGACGRNPVPIVIPCHRVLRSDSSLGGYSGPDGVKQRLLVLEGIPFKGR